MSVGLEGSYRQKQYKIRYPECDGGEDRNIIIIKMFF